MSLNTRRVVGLVVVVAASILFGLVAWVLFASTAVTLIAVVVGALVGLFVFMAQQRGSF